MVSDFTIKVACGKTWLGKRVTRCHGFISVLYLLTPVPDKERSIPIHGVIKMNSKGNGNDSMEAGLVCSRNVFYSISSTVCDTPLGMENRRILNSQITASSEHR